jgi:hypothetical protein
MTDCKQAKLPKGPYTSAGYCVNCGEPVRMGLWGAAGRSQKFGLRHTSQHDPKWQARMGR